MKKDKAALRAELNRLGEAWGNTRESGDEAVRLKLQGNIFQVVCQLFSGPTEDKLYSNERDEAINMVFLSDWHNYDAKLGSLYDFFNHRIEWRRKEADLKAHGHRQLTDTDPETGEKKRMWKRVLEQEPDNRGEELEGAVQVAWNNAPAGPEGSPEENINLDAAAYVLLSSMLNLSTLLEGQSNNPIRRRYFHMFFTDGISDYLHKNPVPDAFLRRERDLFRALELSFLDYFLSEKCRTAPAIQDTPLKPYGQMVEGKPMEEAEHPLKADVYSAYLDRMEHYHAGSSTISGQRAIYNAFLRKRLF